MPRRRWTGRAGIISSLKLQNFMCHENLSIQLHNRVNFITGQNGSGKSAVLAAICVAFGCKARGTQRAVVLKDFIRTGCKEACVILELRNEGPEAYMPQVYGARIIIERKITAAGGSTVLRNEQGKNLSSGMRDLYDIVEHFNIDVENPCVIMSQENSRDFLISKNDTAKFKFFFSATLLRQVSDLLKNFDKKLQMCRVYLDESRMKNDEYEQEIGKLDEQIQLMQEASDMGQELTNVMKKLAWSLLYDANLDVENRTKDLRKTEEDIGARQEGISTNRSRLAELNDAVKHEEENIAACISRSSVAEETRHNLRTEMTNIGEEKAEVEGKVRAKTRVLNAKVDAKTRLEGDVSAMQEEQTQENDAAAGVALQELITAFNREQESLQQELAANYEEQNLMRKKIDESSRELEHSRGLVSSLESSLTSLRGQKSNQLSAFGGDLVLKLVRSIEESQHLFSRPPIGPIGAHCALTGDNSWALAVEVALGRLFNAFIVNSHQDMLQLRRLARECRYYTLTIIIYQFGSPLEIQPPGPGVQTVLSVVSTSGNPTVFNVLVEHGNAEREILVENIDEGNRVVFDGQAPGGLNVRTAYTKDGAKLFVRANCQITLPYDRRIRVARLDVDTHRQELEMEELIRRRRDEVLRFQREMCMAGDMLGQLTRKISIIRAREQEVRRELAAKERQLREWNLHATGAPARLDTAELDDEILTLEAEIKALERELAEINTEYEAVEGRYNSASEEYMTFCESAQKETEALANAESKLEQLNNDASDAQTAIENFATELDVLIRKRYKAEEKVEQAQTKREELLAKAQQECDEEELEALGGVPASSRSLSSRVKSIQNNLKKYKGRSAGQMQEEKSRLKMILSRAKRLHQELERKLEVLVDIHRRRREKFEHSCHCISRQLRWTLNNFLRERSLTGRAAVDFTSEKLSLLIRTPASRSLENTSILSGGERSFTTLSFVLALNEMADAPVRAMDEFDVFMDAVNRTLSLKMLTEFALRHDCQWIFITPDDISSVPDHPDVKKHQMPAPRP